MLQYGLITYPLLWEQFPQKFSVSQYLFSWNYSWDSQVSKNRSNSRHVFTWKSFSDSFFVVRSDVEKEEYCFEDGRRKRCDRTKIRARGWSWYSICSDSGFWLTWKQNSHYSRTRHLHTSSSTRICVQILLGLVPKHFFGEIDDLVSILRPLCLQESTWDSVLQKYPVVQSGADEEEEEVKSAWFEQFN